MLGKALRTHTHTRASAHRHTLRRTRTLDVSYLKVKVLEYSDRRSTDGGGATKSAAAFALP